MTAHPLRGPLFLAAGAVVFLFLVLVFAEDRSATGSHWAEAAMRGLGAYADEPGHVAPTNYTGLSPYFLEPHHDAWACALRGGARCLRRIVEGGGALLLIVALAIAGSFRGPPPWPVVGVPRLARCEVAFALAAGALGWAFTTHDEAARAWALALAGAAWPAGVVLLAWRACAVLEARRARALGGPPGDGLGAREPVADRADVAVRPHEPMGALRRARARDAATSRAGAETNPTAARPMGERTGAPARAAGDAAAHAPAWWPLVCVSVSLGALVGGGLVMVFGARSVYWGLCFGLSLPHPSEVTAGAFTGGSFGLLYAIVASVFRHVGARPLVARAISPAAGPPAAEAFAACVLATPFLAAGGLALMLRLAAAPVDLGPRTAAAAAAVVVLGSLFAGHALRRALRSARVHTSIALLVLGAPAAGWLGLAAWLALTA